MIFHDLPPLPVVNLNTTTVSNTSVKPCSIQPNSNAISYTTKNITYAKNNTLLDIAGQDVVGKAIYYS